MNPLTTGPTMGVIILLTAAFMLSSVGADAIAQTNTAEVGGVVRDISGGALPGATVTARHGASGFVAERVTDFQGRFFLPALRTGQWDITASLPGFAPQTHKGIVLELGRTLSVEFRLGVEGVTENITVAVTAALLQTTTAEISDIIENRQVVQIPLNGRNFLALAQLSHAVVLPPGGTRGDALQQAGPLPNVGGQRSGHNIYLLDGAKVTDELFNNLVALVATLIRADALPPNSAGYMDFWILNSWIESTDGQRLPYLRRLHLGARRGIA